LIEVFGIVVSLDLVYVVEVVENARGKPGASLVDKASLLGEGRM
jgi:hypothetical protein